MQITIEIGENLTAVLIVSIITLGVVSFWRIK